MSYGAVKYDTINKFVDFYSILTKIGEKTRFFI